MRSAEEWNQDFGLHNCEQVIRQIQADALRHIVPFIEAQAKHLAKSANPDDIYTDPPDMRFGKSLGLTFVASLLLKEATKLDGVKRELFDLKIP